MYIAILSENVDVMDFLVCLLCLWIADVHRGYDRWKVRFDCSPKLQRYARWNLIICK